jgi:hypothetical protein
MIDAFALAASPKRETGPGERQVSEAVNYDQDASENWNITGAYQTNSNGLVIARADSAGGWIASPIDLVRFMIAVDEDASIDGRRLLCDGRLSAMYTSDHSNKMVFLKGWREDGAVRKATGSWRGTTSGIYRLSETLTDGSTSTRHLAILMNSRVNDGQTCDGATGAGIVDFSDAVKNLRNELLDNAIDWPSYDLFGDSKIRGHVQACGP